jgi:type I restriction enzyme S subunit
MNLVELKTVCDLQNGYAFKSDDYVDVSNTVSLRMSNIRPGGNFDNSYNLRYLPDDFQEKYSNYIVDDGDLVIAMTDLANDPKILGIPTIVETGKHVWLLNQRAGKIIVNDPSKADKNYLRYILNHPIHRNYYKMFAGGGLQINVGKKEILGVKIPLPPLKTQQRIAGILDDAAALRDKTAQLLTEYDLLAQSIFLEMFGDPVLNPKGFNTSIIEKVCKSIYGGGTPKRSIEEYFTGDIPWVTPKDMKRLYINNSKIKITEKAVKESSAKLIPKKAVLMVIRSGILKKKLPIAISTSEITLNQDMKAFISDETILNPMYLMFFFLNAQNYLLGKVRAVTADNIEFSQIKKMIIPLPNLELQNEFADKIALIEQQKALAKQELQESKDLFNCLLQQAFKGELV